jgi:hypothetical protein
MLRAKTNFVYQAQRTLGNIDVFGIYDRLEKENIMLSFKGYLSEELLNSILAIIEEKMTHFNAEAKTKKRVYNVLVECLQNLYHHSMADGEKKEQSIIVMIVHHAEGYSVITGNMISTQDVENLQTHIRQINSMDPEQLKELYRQVLNNGSYSSKGGGGLGIIDIARRSGEKLDYGFVPVDEFNSFFSLNVKIPK